MKNFAGLTGVWHPAKGFAQAAHEARLFFANGYRWG